MESTPNRSYNMSRIQGKNTKPEVLVRKWLWKEGFRYRLHVKGIPGKPDLVFPGCKKVIFVHGCFWHKHDCKYFQWPKSNADFWKNKILGNVERDRKNYRILQLNSWNYHIVWECELKEDVEMTLRRATEFLLPD